MPDATATSRGLLLIISGPSGVGKTTIAHRVERALDAVFSISVTTRAPGPGDRPGVDYHFISEDEFAARRDAGDLLEWAQVFGHHYGTPRQPVEECLAAGRVMILEIDVQGAIQVKSRLPEAFALFILPPSEQVLLDRLRHRRRDDEAAIQRRFAKAKEEIARAKASGIYDAFIVNDDLERAVQEAIDRVQAELRRRQA
ncbi:MAG TPA: guanylate kinase [Phycisphaeraceae bacterium]